tara:strand:+ start:92 stop:1072 length:981 start_codon:yes stop_codon:yes gene_type:complete
MNTNNKDIINLIADIGGTNIRLAIADNTCVEKFREIETYQCANYASLAEVIAIYIDSKQLKECHIDACLAIACPVDTDIISMTNLPWQFSQHALKEQLNLQNLTLINDYTAIAMAIPLLSDNQKIKIGGGEATTNAPIAVFGPGTGLGVANLVSISVSGVNEWHCFGGEGGHVDFAAVDEIDIQLLQQLKNIKARVSYEQLLSGYGLVQIYQALCIINDHAGDKLSAAEISSNALSGSCPICQQALTQFCKILGSFAGNLALTMNTQGGVYIAGGIVPRFVDYLKNSAFRERFEAKGRLSHLVQTTPTYVITEEQPGLLGAAACLL